MSRIILEIPEDAIQALKSSPEDFGPEIKMAAAAKLFELGRLSSGAAARLAGVPRTVFLSRLSNYGVATFDISEEELNQESPLV